MKLFLSLIAITFCGDLFAQTVKVTNDRQDIGIKETFYVLKSDKKVKDGPYAAYSRYRNTLLCEGYYKNNRRDSTWSSYGFDGQLEVQYNYTHKKLLMVNHLQNTANSKMYTVISGPDSLNATLDQPPIFIDGINKINQLFISNLRYPAKAKERSIQGKVLIAFTVDSLGRLSNYRVKKAIGGGCDEEALRVVKLIEGDWLPGRLNGKPVTTEYEFPVSFTLQIN